MDFLRILKQITKQGTIKVKPDFVYGTDDLMTRGGGFYAVWDEEKKVWTKDAKRCTRLIDRELKKASDEINMDGVEVLYLKYDSTNSMDRWKKFLSRSTDNFVPLDSTLVFENTERTKELYSSHSLDYSLAPGDYPAYDEIISTLYSPEERNKIEWIFGSIVAGKSKEIQKFIVLTGDAGTGKSTVIAIAGKLFKGYCEKFESGVLGSNNDSFPLESLKDNPLVAYDNEADLSKIKNNTILNSLIAHEPQVVNSKYSKKFTMAFNTMLILASNNEVKITDARSGLQRRLIDVRPTGKILPLKRYNKLMKQIDFELGAIAWHCKEVYESDPEKYLSYRPTKSIRATNYIYNFFEENYFEYKKGVSLKRMWEDYKKYCDDGGILFRLNRLELKQEATAYFKEFLTDTRLEDGSRVTNYFRGIKDTKFGFASNVVEVKDSGDIPDWLKLKEQHSLLDDLFKDFPAQYAKLKDGQEIPSCSWDKCKTTLKDLDTSKVHYVMPDDIYIELDLDRKNEKGEKDFDLNVKAVMDLGLPKTYVETSKGGQGLHLIYIYTGDVSNLAFLYDEDVEIKVHLGKSSMRRKVTRCNDVKVATISGGLPLKGGRKMVDSVVFANEKHLRRMILKNLRKEILPATRPSIDLIYKDLERAYSQGLHYDVTDMRNDILEFALNSTHQSKYCVEQVALMRFKSDDISSNVEAEDDRPIVFFDVEVYQNLFVLCWKFLGADEVTKLINPTINQVEDIFKYRLVGFNNRRYDNHILWAYTMGYKNKALYELSQSIISNERKGTFGEAYNLSYADIWDYASNKQSLKKWEIQLKISHIEMGIPWDEPAPEDKWDDIANYCANDVKATEAVWNATTADFKAREILAELSGLTVNDTNRQHITKILVGDEKNPQHVYTNLATGEQFPDNIPGIYKPGEVINAFPGYEYVDGKNIFRGTDVGKGGYVYAEPGMYRNVALLDVGNMHGASILALNKFGEHTKNYKDIRDARMAIKHHDYETAGKLFGGKLKKYLGTDEEADQLQNALKLVLNSTYGIAAATFDNPLRDKRDVNNIIALRGALFMRTLQDEVTSRGFTVAHIKTDSIKIPEATPEIISFCIEFGRKYGYEFEHEATYSKMCLVNGSTYIAKYDEFGNRAKGGKKANQWTATAAQFQIPYVFKTLFSHEPLEFDDFCETKSVQQGALYLDFGDGNKRFIGRVGRFCPVKPECGGADLLRIKDGKEYAATGTKGFKWLESEVIDREHYDDIIDKSYYMDQVNEAVVDISKFGDFEWFTSDSDEPMPEDYNFEEVKADPIFMNPPEELPFSLQY